MGADQVYLCPKCKSEDVKKVSLMYETEVQDTKTRTLGGGVAAGGSGIQGVGVGIASSKGTIKSLLGERIAPPQKKDKDLWKFCGIIMFVIAFIAFASHPTALTMILIVLACAIVIIPLALYQRKMSREYDEAFREWNLNWVCNRCGNVFVIEDKT